MLNRQAHNQSQYKEFIIEYICYRENRIKKVTKFMPNEPKARQLIYDLTANQCEILTVTKKPIKK